MAESKVPPASPGGDGDSSTSSSGDAYTDLLSNFVSEIVRSPLNLALVAIIIVLTYKIFKSRTGQSEPVQEARVLPRIRQDFTVEELKPYNGVTKEHILVAVNGNVYDVTKNEKFYGPGGPYAAFGGRDASRGLATFSVTPSEGDYDDLSDLEQYEMNYLLEWEEQFKERYDCVGKLLRPGESHTNYSDEEEEGSQQEGNQQEGTQESQQEGDSKTKSD